jgi:isoleucyl-tRNA synthetase
MGRAARNAAAVKTRQPLAEVVVALPEAEARSVERLRDVVLDELNAKDLRTARSEDELVAYVVKPNLKVLGPKLGKRLGLLQAALKEADAAAIVAAVRSEGAAVVKLPDGELSLVEEELLIETGSPDGYQVESDAGRVVALKTEVDEALREEGLARELIHAVQLARKAADLRIEDTISLTLDVPGQLRPPAEHHRGVIMAETLASTLAFGEAAGDHRETARVDGHEVGIGLSVTGTIFTVTYG